MGTIANLTYNFCASEHDAEELFLNSKSVKTILSQPYYPNKGYLSPLVSSYFNPALTCLNKHVCATKNAHNNKSLLRTCFISTNNVYNCFSYGYGVFLAGIAVFYSSFFSSLLYIVYYLFIITYYYYYYYYRKSILFNSFGRIVYG